VIRWSWPAERVGLAVIDRPERRNALSAELCEELRARLEGAVADGLRAVVITGEGRVFCAGADLARRAADTGAGDAPETPGTGGITAGGGDTFRPAFEALCTTITGIPIPVIAAVGGPAIGAGTQLVAACDLRVAAEQATFGIPAVRLGVMLSAANIRRLAQAVGMAAAQDLLLTGRTVDAAEAARLGLVQRVVGDALAAALELAGELAGLAPLTLAGHKQALVALAEAAAPDPDRRAAIDEAERRCFGSDDLAEGLAAFAEKRPPRFQGR
jgi:enoyl-CoA hydratase